MNSSSKKFTAEEVGEDVADFHRHLQSAESLLYSQALQQPASPLGKTSEVLSPLRLVEKNFSHLSQPEQNRILAELEGMGPIAELLLDTNVTDILVSSPEEIWVERNGKLELHHDRFASQLSYEQWVQRVCEGMGQHLNTERPVAMGSYQGLRVQMIGPSLACGQTAVALRKPGHLNWTLDRLLAAEFLSAESHKWVQSCIRAKANFLVVGGTSSGKTSLLDACLGEIGAGERAVVLEDTQELHLPNSLSLRLVARPHISEFVREVSLHELMRLSLRLRPDRIVVGEVRGGEAKDLLLALSSGHLGGMGSLHAETPSQALLRLEMLIQHGAPQWNLASVRSLIHLSLHYILITGRNSTNGKRHLRGAYRLASLEDRGITLDPVDWNLDPAQELLS